jgi:predicted RNA-binding Zn-ribbon protein involved in translation (DUF1610 family)
MAASDEAPPDAAPDRREDTRPVCPVCSTAIIAAEASALLPDGEISHLWTCDTCGFGLVTRHSVR